MTSENITSATITTADLAGRYKSTAGSQEGGDVALVKSIMEQVDAQGYVIIKNLFSVETMDALKADVLPRFKQFRRPCHAADLFHDGRNRYC